jgi:hypothetical protein
VKTPLHQHDGTIYDASGARVATCDNPAIAALICERVNTWQAQYAAGYEAATNETNARRDAELARRLEAAERRGYDRAIEEAWIDTSSHFTLVA